MTSLDHLLQFVHFTHQTHKVERVARTPGTNRYANTVEHSYQLTLLAWYLIEHEKLPLNKDLVIKYALVHDLVETYAGDTYFYDAKGTVTKTQREREALEKITHEFPDFPDLHTLIAQYEERNDPEACFVYALDKLIDPLNIYLENGKLWHEKGVSLHKLIELKAEKIKCDTTVQKYFDELITLLKVHESELFPTP